MRSGFARFGLAGVALALALLVTLAAQDKSDKVDATALYKRHCAMCHGVRGDSKLPGMSFVDGQWKHGSSVKDIAAIVRDGVEGTAMLPFKSRLKDPEIAAIAEHVRDLDPRLKSGTRQ